MADAPVQPARVVGEIEPVEPVVAGGAMRVTMNICGMVLVILGPPEIMQAQFDRFFVLAERALAHNCEIANRQLALQEQALQLQALTRPAGGSH